MNKRSLIEKMATETNISKAQALRAVECFLSTLSGALKSGDHVTLSGFGRFDTYQRKSRNGRDPQTGAAIKIPGRRAARFVPGIDLKKAVAKRK